MIKWKNIHKKGAIILVVWMMAIMVSCDDHYVPKPRGYFRIDFPEKEFILLDSIFPFKFEYPGYTKIIPDRNAIEQPYWISIDYPSYQGRIYLSYKPVHHNLPKLLDDSRSLVLKHITKATSIHEEPVIDEGRCVYGMLFEIKGAETASPFQFYVTDSTNHFLRGALYFNVIPNNDSLLPVIDFIKDDILQMIATLEWKDI